MTLALLKAHPDGAKQKDKNGRLPLHVAVERQAPEEVTLALLKAHPDGAKEKDENGRLLLHSAADRQAPEAVTLALLEAHPDGAKEKDENGRLPLHVAADRQAPVEVMLALLDAHPDGAKDKGQYGLLPLHVAAVSGRYTWPVEVTQALLKAHPSAAMLVLPDGRPLSHDSEGSMLSRWLRECGAATAAACIASLRAAGTEMHTIVAHPPSEPIALQLVRARPDLGDLKDERGRTVYGASPPTIQAAIDAARRLLGRFELDAGNRHFSSTAAVLAATDYDGGTDHSPSERRRALKAMRVASHVQAEIDGRAGLAPNAACTVKLFELHVDETVDAATVSRLRADGLRVTQVADLESQLQRVLLPRRHGADATAASGYRFLLVLELADRTLSDALPHDRLVGDFPMVRKIASLDELHAVGRIHADLKPLNIVHINATMGWKVWASSPHARPCASADVLTQTASTHLTLGFRAHRSSTWTSPAPWAGRLASRRPRPASAHRRWRA